MVKNSTCEIIHT